MERVWSVKLDRTKWHRKHCIWYIGHLTTSMERRGRKDLLVNTTEKEGY
jgi:hypothetical protein